MTGQWQGDGETGKDLRFILELEPTGRDDGAWRRSREREESKETSWFIHKEAGAASPLISRVSALSCQDDAKGRPPELASSLCGVQSTLRPTSVCPPAGLSCPLQDGRVCRA